MITMKRKANQLDEMQEQELLRIEHNACWIAFFGLAAAIIGQHLLIPDEAAAPSGETIVLLVMCAYMAAACARKGIWDRRLANNAKTNALLSLLAGGITFILMFLRVHHYFPDKPVGTLCAAAVSGIGCFFLCWIAISLLGRETKKRQAELEKEPEE